MFARLRLLWPSLVAIGAAVFYIVSAPQTRGHAADFGKQWLAARMVASGQGRHLFDLERQRSELERFLPVDVIDHGVWRPEIGGPTYPPTFAVTIAPLGFLTPRHAQTFIVWLSIPLALI